MSLLELLDTEKYDMNWDVERDIFTGVKSSELLRRLIEEKPLSREAVKLCLNLYVEDVKIRSIEFNGLFYKNEKTHFYIIELKEDDSTAEKLKTLIHEIGHVYYNVKGFNPDIEEARSGSFDDLLIIEDLLDEQADIFLRNNPGFAEELIKKYLL